MVFLQTYVVCTMALCMGHHTLNVLNCSVYGTPYSQCTELFCVWDTILSMYWTVLCMGHHTLNVLNCSVVRMTLFPRHSLDEVLPGFVAVHHEVLNTHTSWRILVFWRSASCWLDIGLHSQLCDNSQPKIFCCLWSHLEWQFQLNGEITCNTLWRIMCIDACNQQLLYFVVVCHWNKYVVFFTIFSVDHTICVLWS